MSHIVADSLAIEEEDGWHITTDLFGLQVLTRPFAGPRTDLFRFLQRLEKRPRDTGNPDLTATEWDFKGEQGLIVRGTVTYKGVPGAAAGKPAFSKVQIKKSLVTKTAIFRAANGGGSQLEITYKAPTATYTYARATEPTEGRYLGAMRYFKRSFAIIKVRGNKNLPLRIVSPGVNLGSILVDKDAYYAGIRIYTEVLDATQVGEVWQVTERNDGLLFDAFDRFTHDLTDDTKAPAVSQQTDQGGNWADNFA